MRSRKSDPRGRKGGCLGVSHRQAHPQTRIETVNPAAYYTEYPGLNYHEDNVRVREVVCIIPAFASPLLTHMQSRGIFAQPRPQPGQAIG